MKTFRLIGMALLAVVMCANFVSCSSDDETEFNDANFVGTWYLSSEKWYSCKADGTPDMSEPSYEEEYPYHSDERIWVITKNSNGTYTLKENDNTVEFESVSFKKKMFRKGNDLVTIKSLTSEKMVVEYWDHYFDFFDASGKPINTNADQIVDELEFGYYTFTR